MEFLDLTYLEVVGSFGHQQNSVVTLVELSDSALNFALGSVLANVLSLNKRWLTEALALSRKVFNLTYS